MIIPPSEARAARPSHAASLRSVSGTASGKYAISAKPSPLLGFSFDQEPVKVQIAQVEAVRQELSLALETGTVDPDTNMQPFLDKMDRAGLNDIIEEMQKQIDEWKTTR